MPKFAFRKPARSGWAFLYLVFVGAGRLQRLYLGAWGGFSFAGRERMRSVNPAMAVLFGWALAGEAVNATMLLGMSIILAAVVLIVLLPAAPIALRTRPPNS